MATLKAVHNNSKLPSNIVPLFWQHGEEEVVLRDEIRQMHENGIGGFIVEARPHVDFFGDKWWFDIDVILDEAKKREMKVWFFDDCHFPSGFAAGKIRDYHPEHLKIYLDERHIDAKGPVKASSFLIKAWLNNDEEELLGVVAAKRNNTAEDTNGIYGETLIDITDQVIEGILYWDVPDGDWRISILVITREGGEEGTRDYLNPIEQEAVEAFLDCIYEPFYQRYSHEFGNTIAGFFSDEPRFGNAPTYEGKLGNFDMPAPYITSGAIHKMVLPFSRDLMMHLMEEWKEDFTKFLPCLWYNSGPITGKARYVFMNVVSRLFGERYTKQIGDWCRQHGVKYIGHVVEDNGAHARLGYGSGHFFRAIGGQDYSGFDIVYQIWPEYTSGRYTTPFGYLDMEFFYWGLAKMASSAAHIDPKKNGITVCEIFGAYGWQEGLKLMKWLTDHICVRGVNMLIPHAFSPKYADTDCPPHFYARGLNPQWKYFYIWSGYANRVCGLLSGGRHEAPVAVLYHAEAEWAGEYMPFEKVVRVTAEHQIDCDVVPIDVLVNSTATILKENKIFINKESYKALIIPYAQYLPISLMEQLVQMGMAGVSVILLDAYPDAPAEREYKLFQGIYEKLNALPSIHICSLDSLVELLKRLDVSDIKTSIYEPYLRYYHYENESEHLYFFTNESKKKEIDTDVTFTALEHNSQLGHIYAYNAMEDASYGLKYTIADGNVKLSLILSPYESIFVVFPKIEWSEGVQHILMRGKEHSSTVIDGKWDISILSVENKNEFIKQDELCNLGNLALPGVLPEFSGTIRYEISFKHTFYGKANSFQNTGNRIYLDLGEVYEAVEVMLNGSLVGSKICPPYMFDVTNLISNGWNTLCIDVTNTLAKKLGLNLLDRAMPQEPTGLLGPVRICRYINQ